jgi:DNA-binding transcriptional ArsR family regulator
METFVIKRLEQAKLLTDPFKLKLLEGFARQPATTKQVADRMGEKAPRLYRHVDALVEEGLLTLVEEKPKRGTVERYYKTIADRFEVDPNLFSSGATDSGDPLEVVRRVIRDTESELVRAFEACEGKSLPEDEMPLIMKLNIRGTSDEIEKLRKLLDNWLEECQSMDDGRDDLSDLEPYSAFLTFYRRPDEIN